MSLLVLLALCSVGDAAAVRVAGKAANGAYDTARTTYDGSEVFLSRTGATAMVGDYIGRTKLMCQPAATCDQCFNITRYDGELSFDPSNFQGIVVRLLHASLNQTGVDSAANSSSNSTNGNGLCPYEANSVTGTSILLSDLVNIYARGGDTASARLSTLLTSLKGVYIHDNTSNHTSVKCFSKDVLLFHLGITNSTVNITEDELLETLSYIFVYIAKGYSIMDECKMRPTKEQVSQDLLQLLDIPSATVLSRAEFSGLLLRLAAYNESAPNVSEERLLQQPTHTCLDAEQLMEIYGIDPQEQNITASQLLSMSTGLLQQKLGSYCTRGPKAGPTVEPTKPSVAETYGYGTAAVLIISLLPVLGVTLLPCLTTKAADLILTFFTALAIGTMLSDALMHILPEILSIEDGEGPVSGKIWRTLTICLGTYAFFLFEMGIHMARHKRGHAEDGYAGGHGHSHLNASDFGLTTSSGKSISIHGSEQGTTTIDNTSSGSNSNTHKRNLCARIKPFAAVVVAGDALHNCADGLAVGAGFATSVRLGISLSIAVCCHEVPHEIGNFAVLLAAGIQKWKVLGLSLLSTSSAFIGLYIGASIGTNEEAAGYIFAITAATFFYVSLVDLLPSLIHKTTNTPCLHFLMINMGMLLGFLIMLLFAIYEERITID